jgi:hypothetical protein
MRRVLAAFVACAFATGLGAGLRAESKTIKGEVIDVQCKLKKAENTGTEHADCALSCAKRGAAMGILTPDGVYAITGDYAAEKNKKLIEYVAKNVEATGDVTEKDGHKSIDVKELKSN